MTEPTENQNPSNPETFLSSKSWHELVDAMTALQATETHTGAHDLETVDKQGNVEMITIRDASPEAPNLQTTLSTLPLVDYADDLGQHRVTLYARRTTGHYGDEQDVSLFAVDQATDADGNQQLVGKPGLLYRTATIKDLGLGSGSQLEEAILGATDRGKGLSHLIEGDEQVADYHARILGALQNREPEQYSLTEGFDDLSWSRQGFATPGAIADRQATHRYREARKDEWWKQAPWFKKFGNGVIALLNSDYTDAKDAYVKRKIARGDYR